ncbi:hypothetical protein M3Y99_00412600 [Aphelenchoides fujianensis]|nr:hypothetical protein M3Y99_00412600 [Aphelenchoides fujianensis]
MMKVVRNLNVSIASFTDDDSGYSLSWWAGVGFVDFFFTYKKFPRSHRPLDGRWDIQMALIESQRERVSVSSAALHNNRQPLKLPTANMVTRGDGTINEDELQAVFSVPIYYFNKPCERWTFFTEPTQVGVAYNGVPKVQTVCNITSLCKAPKNLQKFKSYARQNGQSIDVQLPPEVTNLLSKPFDANFNINGEVRVASDQNGQTSFGYNPTSNSQAYGTTTYQQPYSSGINTPFGQFGVYSNGGQQQQGQYNGGSQLYNNNPYGYQQQQRQQPFNQQNGAFYDPRFQNGQNGQNMSSFTVENPNYKFLPDQLNYQYEANAGQRPFYDQNGSPYNSQFVTTTEEPIRSNAEQNRLNYQDIQQNGGVQNPNSQQFTNNIYGYDYRSNLRALATPSTVWWTCTRRTSPASGNEQQYQPPQTQRFPNGRRKRQSTFRGTAYEHQDDKFPRVENTIPTSAFFDDSANRNTGFSTSNSFNTNTNQGASMYYPYRTDVNDASFGQNRQFSPSSSAYANNYRSDPYGGGSSASSGYQLSPHYISPDQQTTNGFSTNQNADNTRFFDSTNNARFGVNNNGRVFNPQNHDDIRQYDDPQCQGNDPAWCKDYAKNFELWFRSYGGSQTQGLCPALRNSLYHSDHHCCQAVRALNC